jgi:CubicO group peptidase (beta-lactamase class C family)
VDEDFERLLRLANVPTLSLATIDGDKITTKSLGVARAGEPTPVTPDSVYAAASLTKAVFSYVFLGFVHDGTISLDKPVRDYLPLPNPDDSRAAAITARRLLSHSSGWRNWRNNASQPLTADFEPGSRWSYSGEGFFFLQRVLEQVTGKSIGLLMRERVFEPLGMKRSAILGLAELEPFQVSGHNVRGEPTQPFGRPTLLEIRRAMAAKNARADAARTEDAEQAIKAAEPTLPVLPNFLVPNAAASLLTTASDFALFLRHLVTASKRGGAPAAIVDLMMSPQIRCNDAVQWGLGVGLEDFAGRRCAWQWGDNPGFKNFFFAEPRTGKAMVVFTNGDRGARIYERVIRATTGEDHPAFLWI